MKAQTEIKVRWTDCDPLGHANNAVYLTYMEQARVVFFRKFYDLKDNEQIKPEHFQFIIAEITCKYLKPAKFDNTVISSVTVAEVKNSSFIFEYEMKDKLSGDLIATARSVQVWYDYQNAKSTPIPEQYRKVLTSS